MVTSLPLMCIDDADTSPAGVTLNLDDDIKKHILEGSKIAAIKLYRKHQMECCNHKVSLKDAKDYVDSLAEIIKKT